MNLQQKTFCYEYLKDFNAVRSYKASGYSHQYADHNAYKLLKHPEIDKLIQEEISKRWDLTKPQWLQGLMELKRLAIKYSDKIRCMELYGKSKDFIGADTQIQNVNLLQEALKDIKHTTKPTTPSNTTTKDNNTNNTNNTKDDKPNNTKNRLV